MKNYLLSLAVAALSLAFSLPTSAQGVSFLAILSGGEEVPANASTARGIALFTLDDDDTTVHYRINVANLHNPVAAHIHDAVQGANGPVVVPLFGGVPAGSGRTSGILVQGSFLAGPDLLQKMAEGGTYVNVHTSDGVPPGNTGPGDIASGEIRGQIFGVPVGIMH